VSDGTRRELLEDVLPGNYLPEACRGCVIVHRSHPLILGAVPAVEGDPAFQLDEDSKVLAISNANPFTSFTYVTICGSMNVLDKCGRPFPPATTRNDEGQLSPALTFVVVAEPHVCLRLGRLEKDGGEQQRGPTSSLGPQDFYAMELERLEASFPLPSDQLSRAVSGLSAASRIPRSLEPPCLCAFAFPLPASQGPYLCTQGVGGHLTHFFPESFHAIDLRCSCNTPVLCIGNGVVREVCESHSCGGVHAANLAKWNSVSVHLDCGLVVDYLHTLPGSATVCVGDTVRAGQVLCRSGDIGFAPEPHLHVELHSISDVEGPSLPLLFGRVVSASVVEEDSSHSDLHAFVPLAGRWYSQDGETAAPPLSAETASIAEPLGENGHASASHWAASSPCAALKRKHSRTVRTSAREGPLCRPPIDATGVTGSSAETSSSGDEPALVPTHTTPDASDRLDL